MTTILAVAAGGALGSVLRFGLSTGVAAVAGRAFPWGTLAVNTAGCLAIGLLYVLLVERSALGPEWRAALLVGVLGGFTTFSTFTMETLQLIEDGALFKAGANVIASVTVCLAATWAGIVVARQL